MNNVELTNLYRKIKNNTASDEEKISFDLEIKKSCIKKEFLIETLEKNLEAD